MSLPRPSPIKIKFGDPIDLQPLREEAKNASKERVKAIYQEATEKIMAAISQIQPHRDCQQFAQN